MYLSPHFQLDEFTRTKTGLPNTPSPHHVEALRELCTFVLEPLRLVVGPLYVSSGYRSPSVNEELRRRGLNPSPTSQHMRGEAADVVPTRTPIETAWRVLVGLTEIDDLPVDQAIVYLRPQGQGWIHVSHRSSPRRELLVQTSPGVYRAWKGYQGPLVLSG